MPFKSEAQRRFMYSQHPRMAKRWEKETPKGADLPEKVKKLASAQVGPPPSPNRKEYPYTGTIQFRDLPLILVENKKGSVRKGTGPNGKEWRTVMPAHYGEFKGTAGADGDPVDVYIGPNVNSDVVYIVHITKPPKFTTYDEDKVAIGFNSVAEVREMMSKAYDDKRFFSGLSACSIDDLRKLLKTKAARGKKLDQKLVLEKAASSYGDYRVTDTHYHAFVEDSDPRMVRYQQKKWAPYRPKVKNLGEDSRGRQWSRVEIKVPLAVAQKNDDFAMDIEDFQKTAEEKRKRDRLADALPGIGTLAGAGAGARFPARFGGTAMVAGGGTPARVAGAVLGAGVGASTGWIPATLRDTYQNLAGLAMQKTASEIRQQVKEARRDGRLHPRHEEPVLNQIGKAFRDAAFIAGAGGAGYLGTGLAHKGLEEVGALNWWKNIPPARQKQILQTLSGVAGMGAAAAYLGTRAMHARAVHDEWLRSQQAGPE